MEALSLLLEGVAIRYPLSLLLQTFLFLFPFFIFTQRSEAEKKPIPFCIYLPSKKTLPLLLFFVHFI